MTSHVVPDRRRRVMAEPVMFTVLSASELRKAVVRDTPEGPLVVHYRRWTTRPSSTWFFDRECRPAVPFHVALDQAHAAVNAPPRILRR